MSSEFNSPKLLTSPIPPLFHRYRRELERHGIKNLETPQMDDVALKLPKLKGDNIEEHFFNISQQQVEPYQLLIDSIVKSDLPEMPKVRSIEVVQQLVKF